jgi:hypothetical protein
LKINEVLKYIEENKEELNNKNITITSVDFYGENNEQIDFYNICVENDDSYKDLYFCIHTISTCFFSLGGIEDFLFSGDINNLYEDLKQNVSNLDSLQFFLTENKSSGYNREDYYHPEYYFFNKFEEIPDPELYSDNEQVFINLCKQEIENNLIKGLK